MHTFSMIFIAFPVNWRFYKEKQARISLVKIYTQDLKILYISINKYWKTIYPNQKLRVGSKKEFEQVKMEAQKKQQ